MSTVTANVKKLNILVEIMHGLGDTVCALSLLKVLRYLYPMSHLTVLCKTKAGRDIIESSDIFVNEIIVLDVYKNIFHTINVIRYLRQQHFDIGVSACITPVKKSQLFMKICGVRQHIGFQALGTNKFDYDMHFVEANVATLGLDYNDQFKPQLYVDAFSDTNIAHYFNHLDMKLPVIGVCIGDADPSLTNRWLRTGRVFPRSWGIKRIAGLIELLLRAKYQVVLIGGPQEVPLLGHLEAYLDNPKIVNLVGVCNIRESMAVVKRCTCSVGIDTGMQHIAGALNVPTVSIFGPTNPKNHGSFSDCSYFVEHDIDCKYCFGTDNYIHCNHRRCLTEITPNQVLDVIQNVVLS